MQPVYHIPGHQANNPFQAMPDPKSYISNINNKSNFNDNINPPFPMMMPMPQMPQIPDLSQFSTSFPTNLDESEKEIVVPIGEIDKLMIDIAGINYNDQSKKFSIDKVTPPASDNQILLSSMGSNSSSGSNNDGCIVVSPSRLSPVDGRPGYFNHDSNGKSKNETKKTTKTATNERYQFSNFAANGSNSQNNDQGKYTNVMKSGSEVSPTNAKSNTNKCINPLNSTNSYSNEVNEFSFFKKEFNNLENLSKRSLFIHVYLEREIKFYNSLKSVYSMINKRIQDSQIFDEETTKEAIETILFNIPKILDFYKGFITTLIEKYRVEYNDKSEVDYGDTFLKHINDFIEFVDFTRHYPSIKQYISTAQKNSMKFRLWLQSLEKQCFSKEMSVIDYLSSIRYHLDPQIAQLQEIFQETKGSNNDIYVLEMVINSFKNMVDDISSIRESNDVLEERTNRRRATYLPENLQHLSKTLILDNDLENQLQVSGYINFDGSDFKSSIPKDLTDGLSEDEFKRQEAIFELCRTERDYLRDLITIRKVIIL
ncbi:hypothetical protein K502DRAFT_186089 [Neoconidiobolus thromboides FSU 785]|nr:hypothetical protein K502DRAFT_186089 [Neoconidiobolus thromboides FSU 785]